MMDEWGLFIFQLGRMIQVILLPKCTSHRASSWRQAVVLLKLDITRARASVSPHPPEFPLKILIWIAFPSFSSSYTDTFSVLFLCLSIMENDNSNQQQAGPGATGSNSNNPRVEHSQDDEMIASLFRDIVESFKTQPNVTPMETDEGGEQRSESLAVLLLLMAC